MNGYDWTRFTVRININRSVADIYQMWITPAAIESWFLRHCEIKKDGLVKNGTDPIAAGDEYSWRWYGYPDEVVEHGEILETNGTDLFRFTFGQEDGKPMICTVKIYPAEGENLCEITQENIPDNEKGKSFYHIGCMGGWSFYLANMKSIMEGGIDLRKPAIPTPASFFSVTPSASLTGTASQSGNAITGVGTAFTANHVGSNFYFADGTYSGAITGFADATHITVSTSRTVAEQAFTVTYAALQMSTSGQVGIGKVASGAKLYAYSEDGQAYPLGVAGTSKGIRFLAGAANMTIQGVDNTLAASYQPLAFGGSQLIFQTNGTAEVARMLSTGEFGVGINSPVARIHSLATTEQLRLGYDAATYASFTVASTGLLTITTTPSNSVAIPNGVTVGGTSSNLYIPSGTVAGNITTSQYLFAGAGTVNLRVGVRGSGTATPSANASHAAVILGTTPVNKFSSGTHELFAGHVFKGISIGAGAATLNNAATVYIESPAIGVIPTNNYSMWVDAGVSRFDDGVIVNAVSLDPSAQLQVDGTTKGTLLQRMTEVQMQAIVSPATGLLVYNTNSGYCYFDGTAWKNIATGGVTGSSWSITGNSGLTVDNFLGSTDASEVDIRQNNISAIRIAALGNVGMGHILPTSSLDIQGGAGSDSAISGAEMLSSSGWTSAGWTGDWVAGWQHTPGNVSVLSNALAATVATKYQITYTVTGRTAGTFVLSFGGSSALALSATGAFGPTAISTAGLTVTPTTDFDGTIVISIKSVLSTSGSIPTLILRTVSGVVSNEFRTGQAGGANVFIGGSSGKFNIIGINNTAVGTLALCNNTTGNYNTAFGIQSLTSNTTAAFNTSIGGRSMFTNTGGQLNTAVGYIALYGNATGNNNVAVGQTALTANTTGINNTGVGSLAGRNVTTGTSNTFVGYLCGDAITTGINNTIIGANVTGLAAALSNNIILATGAGGGASVKAQFDGTNWTFAGGEYTGAHTISDIVGSGSGALAGSALDITQTWNTTGAPAAIKLNVTNTASSVNSYLINLQVGAANIFRVFANGQTAIGSQGLSIAPMHPGTYSIDGSSTGGSLRISTNNAISVAGYMVAITHASGATAQTGGTNGVLIIPAGNTGYGPTSGNGSWAAITANGSINQTGGANGITRGLWINPTLTAAFDWRGIEISNNSGYGIYQSGAAAKNLFAGQVISTMPGALSTPAITATGTWISGGDGTTTKPYVLIEPTGATSAAWQTTGTGLGINAASGFAGHIIDAQLNGVFRLRVDYGGNTMMAGYLSVGALGIRTNSATIPLVIGLAANSNYVNPNVFLIDMAAATLTMPSGNNGAVYIHPTYNQVTSTAANTDLRINRTETAIGSGAQYLIDAQVGGVSKFSVDRTGRVAFAASTTANSIFNLPAGIAPTAPQDGDV